MNTALNEIILHCVKRGIPAYAVYNKIKDELSFKVQLGSKTGEVLLESAEESGFIRVIARYQEETLIMSFDGLASVAFDWYARYKNSEVFSNPDPQWEPIFIEKGWLKVKEKIVNEYEIQ